MDRGWIRAYAAERSEVGFSDADFNSFVRLLDDRDDAEEATTAGSPKELSGPWRYFVRDVIRNSEQTDVARVMDKYHYGLVNVRTDGTTVMCATLDETDEDWILHTFPARTRLVEE